MPGRHCSLVLSVSALALSLMLPMDSSIAHDALPDGTWKWTSEIGGETIHSVLRLESDGKKLTGTYQDQNFQVPVENGEVDGINVWFEINIRPDDQVVLVKFSGELSDSELAGSVEIYVDGQESGEYDWTANRSVEIEDVLGTWNFVYTAPDGVEYKPVLVLASDEGTLVGTISNGEKSGAVDALELNEHQLTFEYTIDYQGKDLHLRYLCKPRGNKMFGTLEYDVDGNTGDFAIAATRSQAGQNLQPLLGTWKFSFSGPDGVQRSPVLKLYADRDQLKGKLSDDDFELEIDQMKVSGREVSFVFTRKHEDVSVDVRWTCELDGNTMTGQLEFDADGNTGSIEIAGKRQ